MSESKQVRLPSSGRDEKESAAAWNTSRERLAKLSEQYEKAKEAERNKAAQHATASRP